MSCKGQTDLNNDQIMTEQSNIKLHFDDFTEQQYAEWFEITGEWQKGPYQSDCLNQHDFKQDCMDCGDIIVMVEFEVDDLGNISSLVEIEDLIECFNRPTEQLIELKQNIMASFSKLILPKSLRNLILTVSIGQGTYC
jgi:hypothetical protein